MHTEDSELDALLLAQSSDDDDDDDSNLAELERSILDRIIDSTDLDSDVPLSTILASSEGFALSLEGKQVNFVDGIVGNGGGRSLSVAPSLDLPEMSRVSKDGHEDSTAVPAAGSDLVLETVAAETTIVQSSGDGEASSVQATVSKFGGRRAGARPGAALAAAAAASSSTPRSRRTRSMEIGLPIASSMPQLNFHIAAPLPSLSSRRGFELSSNLRQVGMSPEYPGIDLSGRAVERQEPPTSSWDYVSAAAEGFNISYQISTQAEIATVPIVQDSDNTVAILGTPLLAERHSTRFLFRQEAPSDVSSLVNSHQTDVSTSQNASDNECTDTSSTEDDQLYKEKLLREISTESVSDSFRILAHSGTVTHDVLIDSTSLEDAEDDPVQLRAYDQDHGHGLIELEIGDTLKAEERKCIDDNSTELSESSELRLHQEGDEEVANSQPSALDLAEEMERRAATAGVQWEKGAATQSTSLDGIKRGRSGIGFLHVDSAGFLSQALGSAAMKHDHGFPQALAVHANYIAVGMSKGAVLVTPSKYSATRAADDTDAKAFLLGGLPDKVQTAVSAMCFNQQGDFLLVGYTSGTIGLWDVPRARLNMSIVEEHLGGIVHIFFLAQDVADARHMKAVSADCTGRVLLHTFTFRSLLRRFALASQCVDVGQGLVLAMSPLLSDGYQIAGTLRSEYEAAKTTGPTDVGHRFLYNGAVSPTEGTGGIVVIVTYSSIVVACLFPTFAPLVTLVRPAGIREGAIPYTSWQNIPKSEMGTTKVEEGVMNKDEDGRSWPVLAVAWDRKVIVALLRRTELRVDAEWELDCSAAGISWLEDKVLVVVTIRGQLLVFTKDGVEVERAALMGDQGGPGALMFHTHFVNAFENPEKASHNSLSIRGAALYMLGPLQLWRARLLPWFDRLKLLRGSGDWMEAFRFAIELYDGHAQGVTGLPRGLLAMREAIMDTLLGLLFSYLDEVFAYLSLALGSSPMAFIDDQVLQGNPEAGECRPTGIETWGRANLGLDMVAEAHEHFARIGSMAIEFCVHIGKKEVVFENVYTRFEAVGQKDTFLELLEPYILRDMLGGLAPEVMQAFVEHYSHCGWLGRVEQCVLHMDISSLDFNQVVRLCREHGLYSALIYLFNTGLDDFTSPLEELLAAAQYSDSPIHAKKLGYKLLVYLKYCFTGLAFPFGQGTLAAHRLPTLRTELLQFLLDQQGTTGEDLGLSSNAVVYPRLWYILKMDTNATLVVLRSAFPTEGILSIGGQGCAYLDSAADDNTVDAFETSSIAASDAGSDFQAVDGVRYLQAVMHAAIQIVDSATKANPPMLNGSPPLWPSAEDVGFVLDFVAEFVASRHAVVGSATLKRIVEYLTSPLADKKSGKGRENLLTKLLQSVPKSDWDLAHTLHLAQRAGFWQVSGWLYTQSHSFIAALDCYLEDKNQPQQPITFVMQKLDQLNGLKGVILAEFREAVFTRLPQLMQHSIKGTLWVVLVHFSTSNERVMKELRSDPKLLFAYLKELMEARWGIVSRPVGSEGVGTLNDAEMEADTNIVGKIYPLWEPQINIDKLLQRSGIECTDEMTEEYLQLLCQFEPGSVLEFLARCENYRLDNCLKLCQDYGITDAATLLLEHAGDVSSALALMLNGMDKSMHQMLQTLSSLELERSSMGNVSFRSMPEVAAFQSALRAAIALCQRNTRRLRPEESDSFWFCLLDSVVEPLHDLTAALYPDQDEKHPSTFRRQAEGRLEGQKIQGITTMQWKMINMKTGKSVRGWLVQMIGSVVSSMREYVTPEIILRKIMSDYASHPFGDFRATISNMLSAYSYEYAILGRAKQLVEETAYHHFHILLRGCTHAYAPSGSRCCVCKHELQEVYGSMHVGNRTSIVNAAEDHGGISGSTSPLATDLDAKGLQVFSCGHAAHVYCMEMGVAPCPVCVPGPTRDKVASPQNKVIMQAKTFRSQKQSMRGGDKSGTSSAARRSESRVCFQPQVVSLAIEDKVDVSIMLTPGNIVSSKLELLNQLRKGTGLQNLGPQLHLPLAPPKKPRNLNPHSESSGFGHGRPMRRVALAL